MEIDVNLHKPPNTIELKTISAGSYSYGQGHGGTSRNNGSNNNNSHSFNNNNGQNHQQAGLLRSVPQTPPLTSDPAVTPGCCGILSRLLCSSSSNCGKTATSSADFNTIPFNGTEALYGGIGSSGGGATTQQPYPLYANLLKKGQQHRRTPQEIYFESRGKSCKKLLKFNGSSNKILLYPEEGWARTASSSYWTITPCWWQPNRCRIEEFAGTQRRVTKAKMVQLEQKGSLLIVGHFRSKDSSSSSSAFSNSGAVSTFSTTSSTSSSGRSPSAAAAPKDNDEFKLYLSSNISMEDYNMGYCLTGFVERRCQQTNTFQMTHFAVIKRQWPSLIHTQTPASKASRVFCTSGGGGSGGGCGSGGGGSKRRDTSVKPT
ncbi:uncharacterized protein LOC101892238 [Musca domestica]|uniref:Uncharacterized protein LOC101892238 n=1 Tax=Musca domestica TaxID=7370 RepID=A0ABM3UP06_MUSDO|nr:uncharacterized protein LOC101892238 [Musca domestica]